MGNKITKIHLKTYKKLYEATFEALIEEQDLNKLLGMRIRAYKRENDMLRQQIENLKTIDRSNGPKSLDALVKKMDEDLGYFPYCLHYLYCLSSLLKQMRR